MNKKTQNKHENTWKVKERGKVKEEHRNVQKYKKDEQKPMDVSGVYNPTKKKSKT